MCMEAGRQAGRGRAERHTIGCSLICVSIISSFYVMGGIIPRFLCIKVDPCVLPGSCCFTSTGGDVHMSAAAHSHHRCHRIPQKTEIRILMLP